MSAQLNDDDVELRVARDRLLGRLSRQLQLLGGDDEELLQYLRRDDGRAVGDERCNHLSGSLLLGGHPCIFGVEETVRVEKGPFGHVRPE